MPNYATVSKINSAYPEISSITAITSAVACQYIDNVEAVMHGYIAKRYSVPVAGGCPLLVSIAERETRYSILAQRGLIQHPAATQGRHPLYQQHIEDIKLLEKIADGSVVLTNSAGTLITPDTSQIEVWSSTMDYNPTFHEGPETTHVQDTDKWLDIEADRKGRGL
jgi:phage gp36-like protein